MNNLVLSHYCHPGAGVSLFLVCTPTRGDSRLGVQGELILLGGGRIFKLGGGIPTPQDTMPSEPHFGPKLGHMKYAGMIVVQEYPDFSAFVP